MNSETSPKLVRGLSLLDATMIVVGSMIGSGIFITSAESSRLVGSPGWLLAAWALAGVLTITGALCCAELAAMWPRAGGQYVFLREAYGPSVGFLFGWGLFLIIQTGTIAAVAVAFANFAPIVTAPTTYAVTITSGGGKGAGRLTAPAGDAGTPRLDCQVTATATSGTCSSQYPAGSLVHLESTQQRKHLRRILATMRGDDRRLFGARCR